MRSLKHYWRSFLCFLFGHQWKRFERDFGHIAFDVSVDRIGRAVPHGSLDAIKRYISTPETRMIERHQTCMRCYKHESLAQ